VVAAVWVVALALVGVAAWTIPRASSSRKLSSEVAAMQAQVGRSQSAAASAQQLLASTQSQVTELGDAQGRLQKQVSGDGKQIAALNAKIKKLKAAKAAAAAAAAAATSSSMVAPAPTIPPPPKPPCQPGWGC
jgi:peptidoglycan hydrolase CwlO-like protein